MAESSEHMSASWIDIFMTRMLRSRISRRVITQQHIRLTEQTTEPPTANPSSSGQDRFIGLVDSRLNPTEVIKSCADHVTSLAAMSGGLAASLPPVIVSGDTKGTFAYIPDHLECVMTSVCIPF